MNALNLLAEYWPTIATLMLAWIAFVARPTRGAKLVFAACALSVLIVQYLAHQRQDARERWLLNFATSAVHREIGEQLADARQQQAADSLKVRALTLSERILAMVEDDEDASAHFPQLRDRYMREFKADAVIIFDELEKVLPPDKRLGPLDPNYSEPIAGAFEGSKFWRQLEKPQEPRDILDVGNWMAKNAQELSE